MLKKLVVVCILAATALLPQENTIPPLQPPDKDLVLDSTRRARASRFNVRYPFSMIEKSPNGSQPSVRLLPEAQPELPYQTADAIVIGEVVGVQPFLSADRKGLYTEYSVAIEKVLKAGTVPLTNVGQSITLFREGGITRLPDGSIAKHIVVNNFTPALNQRCLFFLTSEPELDGFAYRKYWLIKDDLLSPVFPDDLALAHASTSTVAGKPLADVIALLATKLNK